MTYDYQVTLFCVSQKYRPVSCILLKTRPFDLTNKEDRKQLVKEGTQKICNFRRWTARDLTDYEYLKAKIRKYEKGM